MERYMLSFWSDWEVISACACLPHVAALPRLPALQSGNFTIINNGFLSREMLNLNFNISHLDLGTYNSLIRIHHPASWRDGVFVATHTLLNDAMGRIISRT